MTDQYRSERVATDPTDPLAPIQRYDLEPDQLHEPVLFLGMEKAPDGDWCLYAEVEKQLAAKDKRIAHLERMMTPCPDCGADFLIAALQARVRKLEEVLHEISEGKGQYSRDPYEHACNCIEDMKHLAVEALKE
jgi:hypothetical protein